MTGAYVPKSALSLRVQSVGKTIAAVLGSLLVLLTTVTPLIDFLPNEAVKNTVRVALVVLTGAATYVAKYIPTTEAALDDAQTLGRQVIALKN